MPQYRLQTLLEIRERAEEEAKERFSEAMRELAKEQKEQKRLEEDLERRKAERKQKVAAHMAEIMSRGVVGITGINQMNRYEERLKDEEAQVALEIERQKEVVKAAEKKVETRRMEMAEAAKEKKAIEKHKENWQKDVKKAREAREDLAQEEIGNALHLARTRKSQN